MSPLHKSHSGQGGANASLSPKLLASTLFRHHFVGDRDVELNKKLSRDDSQLLPFPVHGELADLALCPVNRVHC